MNGTYFFMGNINSLGTAAGLHSYTTLKNVGTTIGIIFNLWLQAKHAPYEKKVADITGYNGIKRDKTGGNRFENSCHRKIYKDMSSDIKIC
jgi:hypothetical protein